MECICSLNKGSDREPLKELDFCYEANRSTSQGRLTLTPKTDLKSLRTGELALRERQISISTSVQETMQTDWMVTYRPQDLEKPSVQQARV